MNMLPTDLERIQSDFRLRYYHWALDDAHREIRDDFPFLRKIKRASMRGFLNWMQELSPDQQTEVFTALVKRSHKQAVQMAGETMTSREEMLIREFRAKCLRAAQADTEVLHQQLAGTWHRCNRRKLSSLVREYARPVFHSDIESGGTAGYRFRAEVGTYIIYTYFDFGGQSADMSYLHLIKTAEEIQLQHSISVSAWLGISQSEWEDLTNAELESTARAVVQFCAHFMNAATSLLRELK